MNTNKTIDNHAPVLYTVEDIQRIFQIGKSKAYSLMRSDGFPSIRLNKKLYVSQSELNNWINTQSGKLYRY